MKKVALELDRLAVESFAVACDGAEPLAAAARGTVRARAETDTGTECSFHDMCTFDHYCSSDGSCSADETCKCQGSYLADRPGEAGDSLQAAAAAW